MTGTLRPSRWHTTSGRTAVIIIPGALALRAMERRFAWSTDPAPTQASGVQGTGVGLVSHAAVVTCWTAADLNKPLLNMRPLAHV